MSAAPRVSCVMIFRNAERFMAEAVASVFAQASDDWELLLVDDGSSDGGTALARRLAAEQPARVRYLEHPDHAHRGMSASRNLGLAHARGEFLAFLDADDVWLPHKLITQTAALERHPGVAMIYGPSQYWYGWTGVAADRRRDHYGDLGVLPDAVYPAPALLALSLRNGGATMPGICSILVRTHVARAVGGFEDAFRGCYEDQVFLFKVFRHGAVFVTGDCSDRYRQHPWSSCAQAAAAGEYHPELPHDARRVFLDWVRDELLPAPARPPALAAALRRARLPYDHPWRWGSAMRVRYAVRLARRLVVASLRQVLPAAAFDGLHASWHARTWQAAAAAPLAPGDEAVTGR